MCLPVPLILSLRSTEFFSSFASFIRICRKLAQTANRDRPGPHSGRRKQLLSGSPHLASGLRISNETINVQLPLGKRILQEVKQRTVGCLLSTKPYFSGLQDGNQNDVQGASMHPSPYLTLKTSRNQFFEDKGVLQLLN